MKEYRVYVNDSWVMTPVCYNIDSARIQFIRNLNDYSFVQLMVYDNATEKLTEVESEKGVYYKFVESVLNKVESDNKDLIIVDVEDLIIELDLYKEEIAVFLTDTKDIAIAHCRVERRRNMVKPISTIARDLQNQIEYFHKKTAEEKIDRAKEMLSGKIVARYE